MKRLIAFDLETTGLDTGNDRIIEFSFIVLDEGLEVVERHTALVNPERPIPPESTAIHGLTDADVSTQPTFAHFAEKIQDLVKDSILIAHNGGFDLAVLNAELLRAGFSGLPPTHPLIDTLLIERYVNSHKLQEVYERYEGKPLDDAHRAENDTLATVAVLRAQHQRHPNKLPESVYSLVTDEIRRRAGHEQKEYLDHDRRFYRDDAGCIRFNFGQHRDEDVRQRRGYLEWMVRRDFSQDTLRVVKQILQVTAPQKAAELKRK